MYGSQGIIFDHLREHDLCLGFSIQDKLVYESLQMSLVFQHHFHYDVFIARNSVAIQHFIIGLHNFKKGFQFPHKSAQCDDGLKLITGFDGRYGGKITRYHTRIFHFFYAFGNGGRTDANLPPNFSIGLSRILLKAF